MEQLSDKVVDRRIRKTKMQLMRGLAILLKEKNIKEITVKELVDTVDINRSTFYLHYTDIYQMMEQIENKLMQDFLAVIKSDKELPFNNNSLPFIVDIFNILYENKEICSSLLGKNGDISFVEKIESIISQYCLENIKKRYPDNTKALEFVYPFCISGCVGIIKKWLENDCIQSSQDMAKLTYTLVNNATKPFYNYKKLGID